MILEFPNSKLSAGIPKILKDSKDFAGLTHRSWVELQNIARGTTDPEIDSITWIELGDNMAPLTLVANLTTRWRHLH